MGGRLGKGGEAAILDVAPASLLGACTLYNSLLKMLGVLDDGKSVRGARTSLIFWANLPVMGFNVY